MAKSSRQANARISTTVNARYYPTDNVSDGFFLDGRFPGKRESRAADVTLDREDRGSLVAIYGRPESEDLSWQDALLGLSAEAKAGTRAIDESFNTLAESAIQVTGRSTLGDGGREPYFAGIIVQDGEAAAVTLGDGGAYLYRRDALYALTNDDFPLEPIDFNGNPIEVVDEFAAGSAGTVRYSNIINLEQSDSLIVCNRALLAAVGQREFLRILNESDDANEAAGLIVTQASAKSPGVPMQIGIAFVNYIVPLEKKDRLNLGRFATGMLSSQAVRDAVDDDSAKTQTFARKEISEYAAKAAAEVSYTPEVSYSPEDEFDQFVTAEIPPVSTPPSPFAPPSAAADHDAYQPPRPGVTPGSDTDRYSKMAASSFGQPKEGIYGSDLSEPAEPADDVEVDYAQRRSSRFGSSKAARDGFAAASERYQTLPLPEQSAVSGAGKRAAKPGRENRLGGGHGAGRYRDEGAPDYADYNDYEGDFEDKNKIKRIIFFVLLGAIILISLFALIRLLVGTSDKPPKTSSETMPAVVTETTLDDQAAVTAPPVETPTDEVATPPSPAAVSPDPEVSPAADPSVSPTPEAETGERKHTVVEGDTWWGIAAEYYDSAAGDMVNKLAEANGRTVEDYIHAGEELIIPPKSGD